MSPLAEEHANQLFMVQRSVTQWSSLDLALSSGDLSWAMVQLEPDELHLDFSKGDAG